MERRDFIKLSGLATGALVIPVWGQTRPVLGALTPIPSADKKALADVALNTATSDGASYAAVRIGRSLNQFI
ncbi:MAG: twin-arginine translocation signal domain-containing protein, partial [Bacteroidetes bacterium]|nr:twin-arginine translocation signal domain-containing protein [Bacteroidota bacterium]